MRYSGKPLMNIFLMVISVGAILGAMKWDLRASLFPMVVGTFVFFIAGAELLLSVIGKKEISIKQSSADFNLSENIDQALAIRRTFSAFTWIIGFFILILFFGFQIAIPLFVFSYLKFQGREEWGISIILTVVAWFFFYSLFIWLLHTPFPEGWVLQGFRKLVNLL